MSDRDWTGLLGFDGDPAQVDFDRIDAALESYYPQMERDLLALISYPSVQGEPDWRAPFGQDVRDALDFALGVAVTLGFRAEDVDGYVGLADLEGYSDEQVGVLCHLDVVPARAEDWTVCPPFEPCVKEGRIYGRGALDDKGPTIAALYGAAVLADFGVPLSKTVRFILGCNEESGMECVKYYLSKFDPPECGFTPPPQPQGGQRGQHRARPGRGRVQPRYGAALPRRRGYNPLPARRLPGGHGGGQGRPRLPARAGAERPD